jgi:hypothetical protein
MTTNAITQERLKQLVAYDPDGGEFTWLVTVSNRAPAGRKAGGMSNGYIVIRLDGVLYRAHRLAWLYVHGVWPEHDIDHINGRRSDNRLVNLRPATRAENLQNLRIARAYGSSGLLGAHRWKGKWRAAIAANGIQHHLGTFETPQEAHEAYLRAKAQLHPFQTLT